MEILRYLQKICLPLPCPGCGSNDNTRPNALCKECVRKLSLFPDDANFCPGCGGIMDTPLAVCSQCLIEPDRPWSRAYSLASYQGLTRQLITRLKYHSSPEIARALGYLTGEMILTRQIKADIIVPVPLHFMRRMERGYNQAQLLAKFAGKIAAIPVYDLLTRRHKRSRQATRNRSERHKALSGIFSFNRKISIAGKHILLLDDVFTTGATLHAAAEILLKESPASLQVITAARTPMKLPENSKSEKFVPFS